MSKDLIPNKGDKRNRIRVQFDIDYPGSPGKKIKGESVTIPDLNLTVRQLLENHTRGKSNEVEVRKPLYFDLPIPTITDITDVDAYREQLENQLKQTKQFIADEKLASETAEAESNMAPEPTQTPSEASKPV